MTFKKFIAKLFKIKTTIEYNTETMGLPIAPGTTLHNNNFFIENLGDTTIYVAGIPRASPDKIKVISNEIHFSDGQ